MIIRSKYIYVLLLALSPSILMCRFDRDLRRGALFCGIILCPVGYQRSKRFVVGTLVRRMLFVVRTSVRYKMAVCNGDLNLQDIAVSSEDFSPLKEGSL
ncbi:MAG: hypothetical protein MUE44_08595 [Oscillatoriaceae cyanobacterium Prado104]|nr:hypothetical protein [Oscillatoriaceae cyanobacterium Prado104]